MRYFSDCLSDVSINTFNYCSNPEDMEFLYILIYLQISQNISFSKILWIVIIIFKVDSLCNRITIFKD